MVAMTLEDQALAAPTANERDLELVERHLHGDRSAFDELYGRTASRVYNLALRLAGNAEDAAELTQEVFVRVFRHLGRFAGRSRLETWVYRITVNHCRSRLSRRRLAFLPLGLFGAGGGRGEDGADGPMLREPVDPQRGPEERSVAAEAQRQVGAALARLPAAYREAVVLRDLEGFDYAEIAAILRVPIGTVRSRLARGRDQLRAQLEGVR